MRNGGEFSSYPNNPQFQRELLATALRYLDDELRIRYPDTGPGIGAIERLGIYNVLQNQDTLEALRACAKQYHVRFPPDAELFRHAFLNFKTKMHAAQ